jgi:hypothetical protein
VGGTETSRSIKKGTDILISVPIFLGIKMKFDIKKNEFLLLRSRITNLSTKVIPTGQEWATESVNKFEEIYREHLENQGRGGAPPPLSPATEHIYSQDGWPDGSGIRNHIEVIVVRDKKGATALLGIPKGKPTMVAIVQDKGATITVTDKMRGFLASRGIFLRGDTIAIVIPGRGSWSESIKTAIALAKSKLKRDFRPLLRQNKGKKK